MSLIRTTSTEQRVVNKVITYTVVLLALGCLIGLVVGAIGSYVIQAGLANVQSGP